MKQQHNEVLKIQYGIFVMLILSLGCFEYLSGGAVFDAVHVFQKQVLSSFHRIKNVYSSKAIQAQRLSELNAANERLSLMNHQLRYDLSNKEMIAKENRQLRKLIGHSDRDNHRIFAKLERVFNRPSMHLLYVRTADTAPKVGMLAMNDQGHVIGRVKSVSRQAARILLLNDRRSAMPVVVGPQNVSAIAIGKGSEVELIHLPIDARINPGDHVKIAHNSQDGLAYHPLGRVDSVQATPDKTFLIAKLAHLTMTKDIEWLVLI